MPDEQKGIQAAPPAAKNTALQPWPQIGAVASRKPGADGNVPGSSGARPAHAFQGFDQSPQRSRYS